VSGLAATAIFLAGVVAGVVNTVVGSGSLLTFPVLLAVGYPPLVANMSNTVGLAPGNFSGAYGYRRELKGQRSRILWFGAVSLLGGLAGAAALLVLPSKAFSTVVPVLILVACILVIVQPWFKKALERRQRTADARSPLLYLGIFGSGVYGGYFGAAAGVVMLALFGLFLPDDMQRLNGLKNVCIGLINGVAAVTFVIVGGVAWLPATLIAVGSVIGAQIGARIGRRLPPAALRACIVTVGVIAAAVMLLH
jgi:uncharacterized membrane protein YfcA